jgi:two-component system, NarL family, sensor histidine kinase DegS
MSPVYGGAASDESIPYGDELRDRFSDRARALFYARLSFLAIGLGVLAVPSWSSYLGATTQSAFLIYFVAIGYSVTNYLLLDHPRWGRPLTFVTLNFDLFALTAMVMASGGLESPIMAAQVMFTIFFAMLFPRLLAIIPPLLMLPVVARLDVLLTGPGLTERQFFFLIWYVALNAIAVYVMVYLSRVELRHMQQLRSLSDTREESLVAEERLRLAREIHDGLGGEISTLIMQAEYIWHLAKDEELKKEIADLKSQAEDAIDELRRSLTVMRRDFDLHKSIEDHCLRFRDRSKVEYNLRILGRTRRIPSEMQLALFRTLQECLTNIHKHAKAAKANVLLKYEGDLVFLTIADDGVGFDTKQSKKGHYGMINLIERARKFRGTVDVQSAPEKGTTVHVTMVVPMEGSHVQLSPVESEASMSN